MTASSRNYQLSVYSTNHDHGLVNLMLMMMKTELMYFFAELIGTRLGESVLSLRYGIPEMRLQSYKPQVMAISKNRITKWWAGHDFLRLSTVQEY